MKFRSAQVGTPRRGVLPHCLRDLLTSIVSIGLPALALCLTACTSTRLFDPATGRPLLATGANAERLEYHGPGGIALVIDKLDHATPTLAGGKSASDKIAATGAAIAVSGVTTLLK